MEREDAGMPWETFTAEHIMSRMSAREIAVYEETALAEYPEGGGDAEVPEDAVPKIGDIVTQICNRFRGAIKSNPRVLAMGADGTLPDFCIGDAAVLGRTALVGLPPTQEGVTSTREKEYNSAEKFLESLRTMDAQAFGDDLPNSEPSSSASYGGAALLDF